MTTLQDFPPAAAQAAARALNKLRRAPAPGDFAILEGQIVEILECGPALVWVRPAGESLTVAVQRSALDFPDTLRAD